MRISYNWLKEFLPDLKLAPEEVADTLTMHSFEVEIADRWSIDEKVRVVRITSVDPHPNADRLQLATVTDGSQEIRVVCGAPNIAVGQIVPYSPPGTIVIDQDGNPFEIKEVKIRGEKSPGMLNSARELGLGADHGGIIVLPDETSVGDHLVDHLPNDTILEVDLTPNRAHDCFSHRGIARELAAILDIPCHNIEAPSLPDAVSDVDGVSVCVEDRNLAPRYMGVLLEGVSGGQTPLWMQARLWAMGARPISPLVDITNYVNFELGNPSHVFDVEKLPGKKIGVRSVRPNETISLLDNTTPELPDSSLVITANDTPIALAGIMGGADTQVHDNTKRVLLEVANFQAYRIQQTAAALNMRTEASIRFQKGIDPNLVEEAAARITSLISELTGAKITGVLDSYERKRESVSIRLNSRRIPEMAGIDIGALQARAFLERLRCQVVDAGDYWRVTPPTDRLDLLQEHDLIEEAIRLHGLEDIATTVLPPYAAESLPLHVHWKSRVQDILVTLGFTETYALTFESEQYAKLLGIAGREHLEVKNPVAPQQRYLRRSLLPGLLEHLVVNREEFHRDRTNQERALFEVGSVMWPGEDMHVPGVQEYTYVAGVAAGGKPSAQDVVDTLREQMGITGVIEKDATDDMLAPGGKQLYLDGKNIGIIGQLSPAVQQRIKYRALVSVFEINLDALTAHAHEEPIPPVSLDDLPNNGEPVQFVPFSRYPSVLRDISLLIPADISTQQAQEVIERSGGPLVVDSDLFDEFQKDGADTKNIAFHLTYQADDRTLSDKEVDEIHGRIVVALRKELSAEIR